MADSAEKTKYALLRRWLEEKITSGEIADQEKIPSENELARQFGYSRQTVRQAISALETAGLVVRVRGSGTYARRKPERFKPRTMNIGVVITYLDDYVFPSIVQGIESVLTKNNYSMSLGITYNKLENEAKMLAQMLRAGVDGLIVEGTKSAFPNPNLDLYRRLREAKIPFLFINGYYEDIGSGYVLIDDLGAGGQVCEELLRNGHTHIAGVFKSDDMQGHKRYQGFMDAMYRRGVKVHDDAVIWYTTEELSYLFKGDFDQILLHRIAGCTAVICYNDQIAASMITLFRRRGMRVPEDISVISFDDSALAQESLYDLTSIVYPGYEIGRKAGEGILKAIGGGKFKYRFETKLTVRHSVRSLEKTP